MSVIITLLAAAGVAGFAYSLLSFLTPEERQVKRQLRRLDTYEAGEAETAEPLLIPFRDRVVAPATAAVGRTMRMVAPTGYTQRVARRLTLAGNPGGLGPEQYVGIKMVLTVSAAVIVIAMALLGSASPGRVVFFGIIAVLIASFLPDLWLKSRIDERKLAIRRGMPDMLDMLTISVEAGMGFDAAIARIISSRSGPLSEEFGRMLQEVQAGIARRDALRHMADRTQVPELNTFIMAIVQADVFGVSVSAVLRTQSREMRVKRRQLAEELAHKAPVKIVFPLIICILPATLIVIGGPAVIGIGRAFGLIP